MAHRLAPRAETDLDDIWSFVAKESGSLEIANRLIDTLTDRFFMLAGFPYVGRARDDDFGPGCRSVAVGEYVIVYCVENVDVLILRVVHGRRDLEALFEH
ncbi:MAG: type II toxin-antitoxin system RelE/ParE family toxin [Terriglobia bacterium]|jgi:toxin ParE1/3/4